MDSGNERLFRVLSDVGSDLIATAEQRTFARSPWQRILPAAACLLLVGGLALAAAPYFVARPETAYAPAAPTADAVVEESKPEEVIIPEAVEEYAAVPEVQNEAAMGPVGAREQLVFWDTVYYVEALYTKEEASLLLGVELGTVETADKEENLGATVYTKQDAETREDHKERQVPLEIFVEHELGYLYCLTYYLSDDPLMEWEAVYSRYYAGKLDELMERFVYGFERSSELEYGNDQNTGVDLSVESLLAFFKSTLEMEKNFGTRTDDLNDYLWKSDSGYVIPTGDIRRQLDKYLDGYTWDPRTLAEYDPSREALVLETLTVEADETGFEVIPELCSLDEESRVLRLVVSRQAEGIQRTYHIRFEPGRVVYEQIDEVISDS